MGPIVGVGVGETDGATDAVGAGVTLAGTLGRATGATGPVRGCPPPATRAIPMASRSAAAAAVMKRGMRLFSDAERMPSDRASFADRRTRAALKLRELDLAALLVSPGADLFYLSG